MREHKEELNLNDDDVFSLAKKYGVSWRDWELLCTTALLTDRCHSNATHTLIVLVIVVFAWKGLKSASKILIMWLTCYSWILRRRSHYAGGNFENGSFTLKTHLMCSFHTTPEEFKNSTITVILELCLRKTVGREITWSLWRHRFRKAPFLKCFSSTLKRKSSVFKFLRFEERFRKAPFSWRISMEGRPNCRDKAAFSNFSGIVWFLPQE